MENVIRFPDLFEILILNVFVLLPFVRSVYFPNKPKDGVKIIVNVFHLIDRPVFLHIHFVFVLKVDTESVLLEFLSKI